MVKQNKKGAKIVLVSSTLGYMSFLGWASYAPGKHALRGTSSLVERVSFFRIYLQVSRIPCTRSCSFTTLTCTFTSLRPCTPLDLTRKTRQSRRSCGKSRARMKGLPQIKLLKRCIKVRLLSGHLSNMLTTRRSGERTRPYHWRPHNQPVQRVDAWGNLSTKLAVGRFIRYGCLCTYPCLF